MKLTRQLRCYFLIIIGLLQLASCRSFFDSLISHELDSLIINEGKKKESWYIYDPEYDDRYCLRNKYPMGWQLVGVNLGYWQGYSPTPPHPLVMEARGEYFFLTKDYHWDGLSVGTTRYNDLEASLLHDALYHAIKEGAPIKRSIADRAFFQAQRENNGTSPYMSYALLRLFGGFYNSPDEEKTLLIRPLKK